MPIVQVGSDNIEFPDSMNDSDIAAAIKKMHSDGHVDVNAQQPQTQFQKYGVLGSLLPASTVSNEKNEGPLSRMVATGGDLLTLIPRTVAGGAAYAGTLAGGGSMMDASTNAANELSRTSMNPDAKAKGALGFVQDVAYDPATYMPAGKLLEGAKVLSKAPTLVKGMVQAGVEGAKQGAMSGAYQQTQTGNVDLGQTALQAGAGLGLGAFSAGVPALAGKALGNLSKDFARRNVAMELRGGQIGARKGLDVDNALKNDIIGTPREMAEIGQSQLSDLQNQAQTIASSSAETVSPQALLDGVKNGLDRSKNVHNYDDMVGLIDDLKDKYAKAYPSDNISLADAMNLRTQIGDKANFTNGHLNPDADWAGQVYNGLYDQIKNVIQDKAGPELQAINKAQSEIIPVVNAAKRRMPIAESNNRLGLGDLVTLGIGSSAAALPGDAGDRTRNGLMGAAMLAGGRRFAGSKMVTKALYGLGEKLAPSVSKSLIAPNVESYNNALKSLGDQSNTDLSSLGKQQPENGLGSLEGPPKNTTSDNSLGNLGNISATPSNMASAAGLEYKGTWPGVPDLHEFFDPLTHGNYSIKSADLPNLEQYVAQKRQELGVQ